MMRVSKEQKGLLVLDSLTTGRRTFEQLVGETSLPAPMVRQGIDWIRDYDPGALVTTREGKTCFYKLAENADEVAEHVNLRFRSLYRAALRLEKMTANALAKWPESKLLRIMHRHLARMREDIEELVV